MKYIVLLLLSFTLFFPNVTSVTAIVEKSTTQVSNTDLVSCTGEAGDECGWCELMQMVDNIINWLFMFFTLAAVMMVMYVGFKLVVSQGSSEAMGEAKSMMTNLVIGFVIFISAWLIVDTILKMTIDPVSNFGPWNELGKCTPSNALNS